MMSIEDINRRARANTAEAERKRLAKVAQIQREETKRKRDAALLQEQQRLANLGERVELNPIRVVVSEAREPKRLSDACTRNS
jgi:uncharacterized membrane protein YgaE (UPF0421/DUF939 family)